MHLRDELFEHYWATHARRSSGGVYANLSAIWPYYDTNYLPLVAQLARETSVCEIGPGHGSMLAWLRSLGFDRLAAVDASPDDVAFANAHLGGPVVALGDGVTFLAERRRQFGLVVMKAVLEHVPKSDLLGILRAAAGALSDDGVLLIDVPNMDWLLASHERYMDLTHEIGFTRESLSALLSLMFEDVVVTGSRLAQPTRSQRFFRGTLVRIVRRALYILGEGGSDTLFDCRSLVAVARRPSDQST